MTEQQKPQGPESPPDMPEAKPETEPKAPLKLSMADLIYGILFSPVKTYRRVAEAPPVASTLLLVIGLNLVLAVMDMFSADNQLAQSLNSGFMNETMVNAVQAAAPVIAATGFIINIVIWFVYSGLLHLIAEFYGGRGRAVTTFTVYGLAGLPAVALIPVQGLEIVSNSHFTAVMSIIVTAAVVIWGIVLLTIGLREAQRLSTGRALAVVITPWAVGLMLAAAVLVLFITAMSSLAPEAPFKNF
ncbi:hypothetical protein JOC37_000124 [Desulfohalotomaculum tongense]|uniref:Yip1 family protein n=1 Tax=Desulforadius tongensis TaxID=1216062 RepID=UPI001957CA61|nr:Yip1 family protein [Desulforadius tongensis]MBM7853759.1 hypothetical protein [Desulforadius tongensis]